MSLLKIPAAEIPKFRRRLLSWFAQSKRDLPWRRTSNPYRIWLSEIMLQQTRVAAVIPYYERFLKAFPDVGALASAKPDLVLANWAGLGYYSRARNLQSAAKEIVTRHAGEFPRKYEAALALPGIGHYTAAAVLSIAYGAPHAVLDGNVARVIARIGALHGDLRTPATWAKLADTAQDLLARKLAGDWNQSIMELGATVCTPKSPRCEVCPAEKWCRARKLGLQKNLPAARVKRATVAVTIAAAVLLDERGRTLLVRHPGEEGALFSHMWQFPALKVTGMEASAALAAHLREKYSVATNGNIEPLAAARHTVTFRAIRLEPYLIRVASLPRIKGARIVPLGDVNSMSISNATRKISEVAQPLLAVRFSQLTVRER